MNDKKDQREIKISQNYFINQINITNLKNRLIKQTKSKKRDSSSMESEENSNFEKVPMRPKDHSGTIDLNEDNVKLETESESHENEMTAEKQAGKKLEERGKFYYTSGNLNNNRLKNIFRTGKTKIFVN